MHPRFGPSFGYQKIQVLAAVLNICTEFCDSVNAPVPQVDGEFQLELELQM